MTLQIFWPKTGNPWEGGQKEGTNEREGGGEGGSRAKPGNQLVHYIIESPQYEYPSIYLTMDRSQRLDDLLQNASNQGNYWEFDWPKRGSDLL